MEIRIGGGRLGTVTLDHNTRLCVDGIQNPTHCSITFWNPDDRDEIAVFATREQLLSFGKKIVSEIESAYIIERD